MHRHEGAHSRPRPTLEARSTFDHHLRLRHVGEPTQDQAVHIGAGPATAELLDGEAGGGGWAAAIAGAVPAQVSGYGRYVTSIESCADCI